MYERLQKILRKGIAVLIAFAMVFSSVGVTALADEETTPDLSGETTFVFDGDSVTVVEGNDTNYEVVIYDSTDTESTPDTSTDEDGNTVYSVPDGSNGELQVAIKKKGGSYVFTGSGNGSIAVKKEATKDSIVYLNGLDLTSSITATLSVKKDSTVSCTIYVVDGTENTLTDNAYNNDETYTDNLAAENAVMKFKESSNVTITGGGTLNINSYGKNGIKLSGTASQLEITGDVTLNITTAVADGINSESEYGVTISGGTFNITAADDGINADYDIVISAGMFDITSSDDAIHSSGNMTITGGEFTISAGDDALHADYILTLGSEGGGDDDVNVYVSESYEAIEAASVNVYSGTYIVYSTDDSINGANGDLTSYDFVINIYGGQVYASALTGDCLDSNGDINISGGTVIALGGINTTENTAIDCDGALNITGGTVLGVGSASMVVTPSSISQPYAVWTSTGTVTASSTGSSLRSTASTAYAASSSEDGYEQSIGTSSEQAYAAGYSWNSGGSFSQGGINVPGSSQGGGMVMPGGSSSSGFVYNGNQLTITDSDGNVLITVVADWNTDQNYAVNYVLYSSEDLVSGSAYTLAVGEAEEEDADESETPAESEDPSEEPEASEETDEDTSFLYGDVDLNGTVDVTDALEALQGYVGLIELSADQIKAGDVDDSGSVDVTDALYILQKYVGLIDLFPVEE